MSMTRDLRRDWRRWNLVERIGAALLGALAALSVAATIFVGAHLS